MSIEVLPYGVKCNIGCTYCYQKPARDQERNTIEYNSEVFFDRLRSLKDPWTIFGGEPLLTPLPELEKMMAISFEKTGQSSIQTNATLISPRHVELFIKYDTHVGISLDGPEELNDARWAGTLEGTRKMTARSHHAVEMLVEAARQTGQSRLIPSFIIQLHALNIAPERLPKFKAWMSHLDQLGIGHGQWHMLDLDNAASELYLPMETIKRSLLEIWEFESTLKNFRFMEFRDILAAQRGSDVNCCVWNYCDPWNTMAVEGLNGDGTPTQCGRSGSNDGVDWVPAEGDGGTPSVSRSSGFKGKRFHERQLSLYVTPQEHGGCKDCRFWLMCQAHCPGSAIPSKKDPQGDWRYRTNYCEIYKTLFAEAEKRLVDAHVVPMSLAADREAMEHRMYELWANGEEARAPRVRKEVRNELKKWESATGHRDHTDSP